MKGERQGVVYIAELTDPDDVGRLSGEFEAHWESEDGRSWRPGPDGVPASEAIASTLAVDRELQAGGTRRALLRAHELVEEAVFSTMPSLRDSGLLDLSVDALDPGA